MHSIFKHEEALAQMSEIQIDCCFGHDCKLQFVLLKRVESCKNIPCPIVSSSLDSMKPESTCRMLTSPFLFGTNGKKVHTQMFMFRTISAVRIEIRANS